MYAGIVTVVEIGRHLSPVIGGDPFGCKAQGGKRPFVASTRRRCNLRRRYAQTVGRQGQPIEAFGVVDQRGIAARYHVGDDRRDDRIDIRRRLALGGEQRRESGGKAGRGGIEPKRQAPSRGSVRATSRPRRAGS